MSTSFDYSILPANVASQIRSSTSQIRVLLHRTASNVIEIGLLLNQIKEDLPEWTWLAWLKSEFALSKRTAQYYMSAANAFPDCANNPNFNISISVLRKLSRADSEAMVQPIISDLVRSGELVDNDRAIGIIDSMRLIQVGNEVEVTGNHALKGSIVTISEIDGPLVSVMFNGVEHALLPAELSLECSTKPLKTAKKPDYIASVQSHNDLLSEELIELRKNVKILVGLIKQGSIIPDELLERLSNV